MTTLDAFYEEQDWTFVARVRRWRVRRVSGQPDNLVASMSARDGEQYTLLCRCDNYSSQAPSVVFVNEHLDKTAPPAWPKGIGAFAEIVKPPPNCFLCTGLTREGLAHHPEWRTTLPQAVWDGGRHTVLDVLSLVQRLLDSTGYQGRGP